MANILILGGGFGGLIVAERLAASLDKTAHQITLVSPTRKFTFYPALVNLAFGACEAGDITFDLSDKLADIGVQFVQGNVTGINNEAHEVEVVGDRISSELSYDYLVIALGRHLATDEVPGFFENAHHLLGTNAALKFGEAVRDFNEGQIIVGACPGARLPVPVCETAFALAKKFETEISEGQIQLKIIFPESLEAAFGGADLHKELEAAFKRHHINLLYDVPVQELTSDEIISAKGHRIKYDLLMLVPPFKGHAMLRELGITDEDDFVKVNGLMQVKGLEKTYAVGDIVAFSGPKFAHMAVRQAQIAASNLISEIEGKNFEEVYLHEIAAVINAGGADSIFLHYGIWDDSMHHLKKGRFWGWAKEVHDAFWRARHQ